MLSPICGSPFLCDRCMCRAYSLTAKGTGCRMRYDKDTDTDNNRDVEGMWSEQFRSSPSVRYRPAYSETLGGSRTATLGLCPVARGTAAVHGSQTSQAGAEWGGCGPGTNVEGSDGLLSGEAGGHGKVRGIRGIGIDHSQVLTQSGTGPSQYQTTAAPIPERPGHATQ